MRVTWRITIGAFLLVGLFLAGTSRAFAQDDEILPPQESAAKARQLLQAAITALGGPAYLNVRNVTCTGRIGEFDHSGAVSGYEHFVDYNDPRPPFKERQENLPKRNIIQVFNGDKGWELDRGGVANAPASDLAQFKENTATDIDNILRHRIHEPGMILRYAGPDIVELKQVDWVELVDSDNRTIRIAIARSTHLPIQETVEMRNPKTQMKISEVDYFSDYHRVDGIETPFQIARHRNGLRIFQVFFGKCSYNTNLSDAIFTKESLEERWAHVGHKHKHKNRKKNKHKQDADNSNS